MSREVLFRGKRIDNREWVEGGYAENGVKTFIIVRTRYIPDTRDWDTVEYYENNPCYHLSMIEVDPETVCQYTGLTDKNIRKIFENDIAKMKGREIYGLVKIGIYSNSDYGDSNYGCYIEWNHKIPWKKNMLPWLEDDSVEIMGNILDNPELLKGDVEE